MKCVHCQGATPKRSLFCGVCGKRVARRCPRCDKRVAIRFAHCTRCGLALDDGMREWPDGRATTRSSGSQITQSPDLAASSPSVQPVTFSPPHPADRFLPRELAAKLESARASGAMEGERRVVTMLFCDVKGSTAAAEQLDPEEWTEIINAAFEQMIRPVYKYEGTVARLMGDGILAFFGAPIAHEDDPQRAVLAALDILDGFRNSPLAARNALLPRIGINTGLVVVGAVGSDLRMEYTAMGDAINLAARMEQTAESGTVQIAEATWRQVAPLFELEELGGIEVKGKSDPVRAWRVIGRRSDPGRMRGIEGVEAALIGQEHEWQQVRAAAEQLQKGVGGIVFLVGEAGLGKSRLIRELGAADSGMSKRAFTWLEAAAYSYETVQSYALFQRLVRRAAMILHGDGADVIRPKLDDLVEGLPQGSKSQCRRVLHSLFGLGDSDGPPLEGEAFRGQLFVVAEVLWRSWAATPLVIVCDDIHWSDPASAALLQHLLPLTNELPILLLCATRPDENAPGWALLTRAQETFPHCTRRIDIRPLSVDDSNRLIDSLLAIDNLPGGVRQRILDNADGNPFFVEEVVRTLLETEAVVRRDGRVFWSLDDNDPDFHIPASLQALITARIDRLDESARRTLQLAALIGRSFYLRVLQAIAEGGLAIEEQVTVLQQADLIREIARIPEREYNFRHILTQEAAYRTILRKERRAFHHQVAQAIVRLFPDQLSEQAAALAGHYAEAEEPEHAIHYYALAGHNAYRLYATQEALAHYNRAVELARDVQDPGAALTEDLLPVYSNRGRALELELDFEGAVANYAEMVELGDRLGDPRFCLAGWLAEATIRATFVPTRDPDLGMHLAQAALSLARERGDVLSEVRALWNLLLVDSFRGSSTTSMVYGEDALAICAQYEDDPSIGQQIRELKAVIVTDLFRPYLFGGQIQRALALNDEAQSLLRAQGNLPQLATALINSSVAYFELGRFDDVRTVVAEADRVSRSIGNVGGEVGAGFLVSLIFIEEGRIQEALAAIEHYIDLGEQVGQIGEIVLNRGARGWLWTCLGCGEKGLLDLEEALEASSGIPFLYTQFLALAAQTHLRLGQIEQAAARMAEAETQVNNDFWFFTLLFVPSVKAELALAQGHADEAISLLEALLARYERVGSQAFLYDIHLVYGQALLQIGRRAEAVESLSTGLEVANRLGARRTRWQLLRLLADLTNDETESARLRREAQIDIEWIMDKIPTQELRDAFSSITEAAG